MAEDAALRDDVGAVGDAERFADVVVRDENSDATLLQVEDDLLKVEYGDGIDAAEGLVQQDEAGVDAEATRNLYTAALATGERIALCATDVAQIELFDELRGAVAALFPAETLCFQDGKDVLFHREFAEDAGFLRQIADAVVARTKIHGCAGDVFSSNGNATGIGAHEADDHVEAGSLARAVGAEKADNLALRDIDAHAANDFTTAIALGDAVRGKRVPRQRRAGFKKFQARRRRLAPPLHLQCTCS